MRMNSKTLIGLPVKTRSGTALGKVSGFEIEMETGRMASLHVKTRGLVPGLMDHELIVMWDQILEMTDKEVTVQDNTVPAGSRKIASAATVPAADTAPTMAMRTTEIDNEGSEA